MKPIGLQGIQTMTIPIKIALGLTAGSIAAFLIVKMVFTVLAGLIGLILSIAIPLVVVGVLVLIVLRVVSPRALSMLRRLGR
ncbi:MAG: hypothetical protein ACYC96_10415 [Fimbriimonadaceae bacterium]